MDNEKLKQFIFPIVLLLITLFGTVYFLPKSISTVKESIQESKNTATLKKGIEEKQHRLKELEEQKKREAELEKKKAAGIGKPFYRPIMSGLDTEAVIAGEFQEILQIIRANRIKVRSINYDYDPSDDEFIKGAPGKYNVASLNMEMIGDYTSYGNFLKEMYKHEHFLNIQSLQIVPYRKNKRILLINFKLKLYAQK